MKLHPDIEDILIKDFTNDELTQAESKILKAWLNENHKNEKVYAQMKLAFLSPKSKDLQKLREEIWLGLQKQMNVTSHNSERSQGINYFWTRVAAILVFSVSIGLLIYQIKNNGHEEVTGLTEVKMIGKVSQPGQKLTTSLPDGSLVKLNGDSKILYAENFIGDNREIFLYGEAFFEVVRDDLNPFVIKTKDIEVKVVGTSFNVKSYPGKDSSIVAVASGKVAVTDLDHQTIALFPGEKISYQSDMGTMSKEVFNWEVEYGWKENILVFHEASFSEINEKLSKWYGVDFKLEGDMPSRNKKFSGRYTDPTLKAVLEGLSYIYDFNYIVGNKTVIIKTKPNEGNGQ